MSRALRAWTRAEQTGFRVPLDAWGRLPPPHFEAGAAAPMQQSIWAVLHLRDDRRGYAKNGVQ